MDHQTKGSKVAESLYQLFKLSLSMYQEWITNQKVVKLRSLYIKCLKLGCICVKSGSPNNNNNNNNNNNFINKEKVVKLRSLYIKCLKLACLCIISVSPTKK